MPALPPRHAAFNSPETYAVGEMRTYDDGLAITLDRIDDSRCKPNVQCVWAGELAPVLTLRGGGVSGTRSISLGTSRTARAQVDEYALLLDSATEATATITVTPGSGASTGTGVSGTATVGPTCPVERSPPDPACADRPYAGNFEVESVGGAHVAGFTSGTDGRYSIALAPGSYQIRLRDANAMPSMAPQPFNVRTGWSLLNLQLDSGIR
ncbi:MAG: hypothetical protein ACREO3_11550 [Arenimonas sp.]